MQKDAKIILYQVNLKHVTCAVFHINKSTMHFSKFIFF